MIADEPFYLMNLCVWPSAAREEVFLQVNETYSPTAANTSSMSSVKSGAQVTSYILSKFYKNDVSLVCNTC